MRDPLLDRGRIETPEGSRCWLVDDLEAEKTRSPRRVKAKRRVWCHANSLGWDDPKHQRAGRGASAVNDNAFSRISYGDVSGPVGPDIAAPIVLDPQVRRSRMRTERNNGEYEIGCYSAQASRPSRMKAAPSRPKAPIAVKDSQG